MVTGVSLLICPTVAVKPALVSPSGTVRDPGILKAAAFFESVTCMPPLSAALVKPTVQFVDCPPANSVAPHESDDKAGGASGGFTVMENVPEPPFALAVTTTLVSCATDPAVALKVPELAPAEIETDEGIVTAALLLERETDCDPLGTALFNVTVQVVAWPEESWLATQDSEETVGGAAGACTVTENVRELLLALAVSVVLVSCATEPPVAVKVPELAPEEIEIDV
jgi:hypothetical protein